MLAGNACIRKTIRVFLAEVVDTTSILHRPQRCRSIAGSTNSPQSWARRTLASSAESVVHAPGRGSTDLMPFYTKQKQKAITTRLAFDEKSLREELIYLRDPLKLADYVDSLLRKNGFEKAAELVRMAGRNIACTVSWNHLISYEMSQGRAYSAVKLYNEMKKRAQVPDARTFTILFRGFANHAEYPHSLDRALSIYQSMFAETCPVKPSIIHTNAVLNVCARAMDVDALLGIAAKLPTRGKGAPNNVTFTTIINAIRTVALKKGEGLSIEEKVKNRQPATDQGRRIWGEVRDRWQNRDIEVDEQMACAMGRILLLGSDDRDYDDVLSLVEQTMGIPRQAPRLENRNDKVMSDQRRYEQLTSKPEPDGWTREESTASQSPSGVESEGEGDISGKEFDAVDPRKIMYAQPGRNTLSMVMDACIRLRAFRAAQDYWGLLTHPSGEYQITPDGENYHMYLRLLRAQRASKLCVEMLEELCYKPPGGRKFLEPKTFRIAMSTCLRDVNNPNVLTHANKMVQIMLDSMDKPDLKALGMYLDIALNDQHCNWKSLLGVLRGSEIGVRNLRSFLAYGEETDKENWQRDNEEETIKFVSRLVGAFDKTMILGEGEMSLEEDKFCKVQRNKMLGWVLRMKQMGRGRKRRQEKRSNDEGGQDQSTDADDSTKPVPVDRGKDKDGRSRWSMTRDAPQSDMNDNPTSPGDGRKQFLGSNYRPSSIFAMRKTQADTRMKDRSDQAQERLREKATTESERW